MQQLLVKHLVCYKCRNPILSLMKLLVCHISIPARTSTILSVCKIHSESLSTNCPLNLLWNDQGHCVIPQIMFIYQLEL